MKNYQALLILLILTLVPLQGLASEHMSKKEMGGWELDGAYNQLYDLNEVDSFKATVVGFETEAPMAGMSKAVILLVRERPDDEIIKVHVCPLWFAKPSRIGVRKGDRVKVKGAWAEIDGKEVVMASKIKRSEHDEFKVRLTSDGTPFWVMSPEQLAKETTP
jgi:hypothetical protein